MAVRIEFFTIEGSGDFELVGDAGLDGAVAAFDGDAGAGADGAVRCVGWLSASDDDEARFGGWCEEVEEHLGIGLLLHGLGEGAGLPAVRVGAVEGEPEASWAATLHDALDAAAGARFGWRTHFDQAGTAGTDDDFPTATHRTGP